jgi:SAM-dependent methyltransferase
VKLTPRERATADLYADLHHHATDTFALEYLLPGFRRHLAELGLPPDRALTRARFLDAGCGGFAGGVAVARALGAAEAVGVDFSEANIESARRRFSGVANARFEVGNLLDLPLPDGAFDFVYCNGVLMITEDPKRAFRELVRVLNPGGRIYIGVYGRGGVLNEVAVPAVRLIGRIVPRPVTARLVRLVPWLLKPSSSLLDYMYVPIQIHYRISEVEAWFTECGMKPVFLRHYREPDTWWNRLWFGDGTMIFLSAVKPCPQTS